MTCKKLRIGGNFVLNYRAGLQQFRQYHIAVQFWAEDGIYEYHHHLRVLTRIDYSKKIAKNCRIGRISLR